MAVNPESGPAKKPGLRAQKMQDKRERILRAATELFARDGFHYTHTGEIAKRATIATGTLYLYFRSKDEVLLAIVQEAMAEFTARVGAIVDGDAAPDEKFRHVIRLNLDELAAKPDLAHILLHEVRQGGHDVRKQAFAAMESYVALLRRLVADGQAAGRFRPVEPALVAEMVFGAIEQVVLRWLRHPDPGSLSAHAEPFARLFLGGLLVPGAG